MLGVPLEERLHSKTVFRDMVRMFTGGMQPNNAGID